MKTVAVILAPGFEEGEAVIPIDLMRRAGLSVRVVGLESARTVGSHGLIMTADLLLSELHESLDALVLPGGSQGAKNLGDSPEVRQLINKCWKNNKIVIGAICAAPVAVLGHNGFLKGRKFTCYPGMEAEGKTLGGTWVEAPVVQDNNLITSRALGTASLFGFALIDALLGQEASKKVAEKIYLS